MGSTMSHATATMTTVVLLSCLPTLTHNFHLQTLPYTNQCSSTVALLQMKGNAIMNAANKSKSPQNNLKPSSPSDTFTVPDILSPLPAKAWERVSFLRKTLSLTDTELLRIYQTFPILYDLSVDRNLSPTLEVFRSFGFTNKQLKLVTAKMPQVLALNSEWSLPEKLVEIQQTFAFSDAQLINYVTAYPMLLLFRRERHAEVLAFFTECVGLSGGRVQVRDVLVRCPALLTTAMHTLTDVWRLLTVTLQLSVAEARKIVLTVPRILSRVSLSRVPLRIALLQKELQLSTSTSTSISSKASTSEKKYINNNHYKTLLLQGDLKKLVLKEPRVLVADIDTMLRPNLFLLRAILQLPEKQLTALLLACPDLLILPPLRLKKKLFALLYLLTGDATHLRHTSQPVLLHSLGSVSDDDEEVEKEVDLLDTTTKKDDDKNSVTDGQKQRRLQHMLASDQVFGRFRNRVSGRAQTLSSLSQLFVHTEEEFDIDDDDYDDNILDDYNINNNINTKRRKRRKLKWLESEFFLSSTSATTAIHTTSSNSVDSGINSSLDINSNEEEDYYQDVEEDESNDNSDDYNEQLDDDNEEEDVLYDNEDDDYDNYTISYSNSNINRKNKVKKLQNRGSGSLGMSREELTAVQAMILQYTSSVETNSNDKNSVLKNAKVLNKSGSNDNNSNTNYKRNNTIVPGETAATEYPNISYCDGENSSDNHDSNSTVKNDGTNSVKRKLSAEDKTTVFFNAMIRAIHHSHSSSMTAQTGPDMIDIPDILDILEIDNHDQIDNSNSLKKKQVKVGLNSSEPTDVTQHADYYQQFDLLADFLQQTKTSYQQQYTTTANSNHYNDPGNSIYHHSNNSSVSSVHRDATYNNLPSHDTDMYSASTSNIQSTATACNDGENGEYADEYVRVCRFFAHQATPLCLSVTDTRHLLRTAPQSIPRKLTSHVLLISSLSVTLGCSCREVSRLCRIMPRVLNLAVQGKVFSALNNVAQLITDTPYWLYPDSVSVEGEEDGLGDSGSTVVDDNNYSNDKNNNSTSSSDRKSMKTKVRKTARAVTTKRENEWGEDDDAVFLDLLPPDFSDNLALDTKTNVSMTNNNDFSLNGNENNHKNTIYLNTASTNIHTNKHSQQLQMAILKHRHHPLRTSLRRLILRYPHLLIHSLNHVTDRLTLAQRFHLEFRHLPQILRRSPQKHLEFVNKLLRWEAAAAAEITTTADDHDTSNSYNIDNISK